MKLNLKKGFTLIELLVVIAIIGILSGIVLTSLGTARTKARTASAMSSLSSMRAQAETSVTSGGSYPSTLCTGTLLTLGNAVQAQGGSFVCGINSGLSAWGVGSVLPDGSFYCVDSTGYSGTSSVTAATEIAAGGSSADVVCDNT
jgi:prepilin-type N-terminal cleavage/methylation domain-containing protein